MREAGIGYFGDARRAAAGEELIERAVAGGTLMLRKLAESRAAEVRYQRFLSAAKVTVDELLATAGGSTAKRISTRPSPSTRRPWRCSCGPVTTASWRTDAKCPTLRCLGRLCATRTFTWPRAGGRTSRSWTWRPRHHREAHEPKQKSDRGE